MSTKNQHQGKLPVAAPKSPLPEEQPAAASGFPIVGIGASAGGLAAFEAFFSGMPVDTDPGIAFVLVQHLDPNHKSMLTDIIRRYTRMQVFEVQDGVTVKPNCVYIIPPNSDLAFLNGGLQLIEPVAARTQRLPIDFFFCSLAQDQHERAIGVVLSGTGSDGTLGAREIKGKGGLVLAQKPESAQYDGMPRSVIATGMVDFELPPAEMPTQIIAYVAAHVLNHPATSGFSTPPPKAEAAMKKIFILLRAQTGHDFSQYKPSTIHRRIERRMAVHQIKMMDAYVRYLQQTSAEVEALFRDLLIGVTSFFRDPEAFQALEEQVIPKLLADRPANTVIRVWVPGCSTGEEAYSLAILLQEQLETLKRGYKLQIFASDIDSRAIATARIGIYPISSTVHLSPERQSRFFIPEPGDETCRIRKNLRDLIVFSEHDVIKDPPFSKVDLISCRNLLIYMDGDLQKKLMPLFHYAVNPGGFLFLGTSETPGDTPLFAPLDRKAKLYQRKEGGPRTARSFAPLPITPLSPHEIGHPPATPAKLSPREMAEKTMLQQLVPASALVNAQGDIIYIHGRTGMYLELAPGEASINNILKTAREGLRRDLAITLHKAVATGETMCQRGLRVKTNGHFTTVNLTICPAANNPPVTSLAPGLYLVILEEVAPGLEKIAQAPEHNAATPPTAADTDTEHIALLTKELRAKEEYLQSSLEELETSSEELKSSNEEMQSMNEELQSSNEELETSKEELQSINEELSTVNAELQVKVADLARANNDMNNLLAGTSIGTVFVDHQLRILRFTPAASAIINLIPSDVGRPVSHLVSNLVGYNTLVADVTSVLNTLVGKAVEVQTIEGRYYTLRILPYRTLENVIEGAVMTFADITEIKAAEVEKGARAAELVIANKELAFQNEEKGKRVTEALAKANDLLRLAVVVHDAHDAITVQDMEGRTLAWNPGATRLYGWTEAEALAMNVRDRIPEPLRESALTKLIKLSRAEILEPYHTQRLTKTGATVEVSVISTALINETGKPYAIATTERLKTKGEP